MTRHLQNELDRLKKKLLALSALVEENVHRAVRSISTRDRKLAKEVIKADNEIDLTEVEVEEECLKILALHQPVAIDLRFLIAALKINNDLERIGDLSVNVAERTLYLTKAPPVPAPFDFDEMADKTCQMLKKAIDALINMDTQLANQIFTDDDEVDAINREMYTQVYEAIQKEPKDAETFIHYLSISRHLERIADYTTNIAEDVVYMVEGRIIRHQPEFFDSISESSSEST